MQKRKYTHGDQVQIIYLGDDQEMSVGEKRNLLMSMAKGEYMCFVDDDDRVTHNYVEAIMGDLLQHPNKDVYTFKVSYSDG
jgi:glycosyltransferase involved in cell wall biosynthesis